MIRDFMFFMILVEWHILWVHFWNRFRGTQTLNVNYIVHPQCISNVRRYIKKKCMDQLIFALGQ